MKQNFYKNEYTNKEWKSVIDEALKLGCKIEYSIYGNVCTIDCTELENRILKDTQKNLNDSASRMFWAERIFMRIDNAKSNNK